MLFFISMIVWNVNLSENVPLDRVGSEPGLAAPHYVFYEYTPTENGYNYRFYSIEQWCSSTKMWFFFSPWNSYSTNIGVYREESFEILNRGNSNEEFVLNGELRFNGDDEYHYTIYYGYDKSGRNVTIDYFAFDRIPPNTLKSLIGWLLCLMSLGIWSVDLSYE